MTSLLRDIREGMKVFDSANHEIGSVEWVKFIDRDPATGEAEAAGLDASDAHPRHTIIDNVADAFRNDGLPEEVRERLLHDGFVRIDAAGLFAADRYVLPEQIQSVGPDSIVLKVSKDELLKRP